MSSQPRKRPKRPTTYTSTAVATCDACDFRVTGRNALANAAKHHDATGHVVTTEEDRIIVYGDRGQDGPSLFDSE